MKFEEVLKSLIARFEKANVDFVLCGGLALATMNIFRFTKDIDFLIFDESKERVHKIMVDLDYQPRISATMKSSFISPPSRPSARWILFWPNGNTPGP
jgi:hypothetical protein